MQMEAGHFTQALQTLTEALALAQSLQDRGAAASVLNNLGMTLRNLARYDEAWRCLEQAAALAPSEGPFAVVARTAFNNLSGCALHLHGLMRHDPAEGLAAARRAIALNPQPSTAVERQSRVISESNAARLHLLRGDLAAAAQHAAQVQHWAGAQDTPRLKSLVHLTQGMMDVHSGDTQRGLSQLRQALDLTRRHLPSEVHDVLDACIGAYRIAGQADVALVHLHELQALHREARTRLALSQHQAHLDRMTPAGAPRPVDGLDPIDRATMRRHGLLRGELGQREALHARVRMLEQQSVAAELHDDATGRHCYRVGRLAALLAREVGLEDEVCFLINLAARLHHIGKLAVPDALLLKPGTLTPEERVLMETHTVAGARILAQSRIPQMHVAETIARHHHERWDGTGYPDRLSGIGIPIAARVTALADVFDALTHERPYKKAWPMAQALAEIRSLRGRHFDPELTDLFVDLVPRLHGEVGDLDRYLGADAEQSPFVQARDQLAASLRRAASQAASAVG